MSDLIAAAKEMLAIAQGKQPAARVYVAGSSYVPEADYEALCARLAEAERERDRYASDAAPTRAEVLEEALRDLLQDYAYQHNPFAGDPDDPDCPAVAIKAHRVLAGEKP